MKLFCTSIEKIVAAKDQRKSSVDQKSFLSMHSGETMPKHKPIWGLGKTGRDLSSKQDMVGNKETHKPREWLHKWATFTCIRYMEDVAAAEG